MIGTLIIRPVGARLVKDTDWFTKMDPYLVVTMGSQTRKTKVHDSGGKNPAWPDVFTFDLNGRDQTISFVCFDKDYFTADDYVAEC